jgi:16S rRNA (guanine966-N2)-methyltransferase
LFDIIQFDVKGSVFFDLFAGTGANGIEAISRGAAEVVFCDNGRLNRSGLYENLSFTDGAKVWECDFRDALNKYAPWKFDFIYIDPPFDTPFGLETLKRVSEKKLLTENGTAIWEYPRGQKAVGDIDNLRLTREKQVGGVTLAFYKYKTV